MKKTISVTLEAVEDIRFVEVHRFWPASMSPWADKTARYSISPYLAPGAVHAPAQFDRIRVFTDANRAHSGP